MASEPREVLLSNLCAADRMSDVALPLGKLIALWRSPGMGKVIVRVFTSF